MLVSSHGDVKVLTRKGIEFSAPRIISVNPWDRRPLVERTVALSTSFSGLQPREIDRRIQSLRLRVSDATRTGGAIEMNAKFAGRCSVCHKEIRVGARIKFDTEKRSACHVECKLVKPARRVHQRSKPPETVRWAGMADTRKPQAELIYRGEDGEIRHKIMPWDGSTNYPAVREWASQYSGGPKPHCVRVTLGARVLAEWKR